MSATERNGREFGKGTFIGDHADENGFFGMDTRGQALDMAWSHACVIAQELTNPDHPTFGPDWMLRRYAETNFWFGYILEQAAKNNPELFSNLSEPIPRKDGEPVGNFEEPSVPSTHLTEISPMGRIYGYALPRIHIEAMGRGVARNPQRAFQAIRTLDSLIKNNGLSPAKFLVLLSNKSLEFGADPKEILSHILPSGILQEENCLSDYQDIAKQLRRYSHKIWSTYISMTTEEKKEFGIAEFELS